MGGKRGVRWVKGEGYGWEKGRFMAAKGVGLSVGKEGGAKGVKRGRVIGG